MTFKIQVPDRGLSFGLNNIIFVSQSRARDWKVEKAA